MTTTRTTRALAASIALMIGLAACSGDSDEDAGESTEPAGSTTTTSSGDSLEATSSEANDQPSSTPAPIVTPPPVSTMPAVADTGVPGLDSSDDFCAAWSRFGGSWQVLVQASALGDDPAALARLEVLAATVVGDAYDDVMAVWPAELASERDLVADAYFGVFERRSADALQALLDAGADEATVTELAVAWNEALAGYDPNAAVIEVTVPEPLDPLVDEAATGFAGVRVPLASDPSMVITASTPLTDEFLATACPDQGWIVGEDAIEG